MRQTIKARYHYGELQPLEPLGLANETEVQVSVDTALALSADEILRRAAQVYQGLTADEITQVESIALDRQHFLREPAAQCRNRPSSLIPISSLNSSSNTLLWCSGCGTTWLSTNGLPFRSSRAMNSCGD
ncbi:MAG: antitoxin family protein [Nitrospira sp.]|nr:antitoxin family protein [Nitrospira sp.]